MGSGITRQLVKAGFDPKSVDYVFFTHLHIDHISDFPFFLKANWLLGRKNKLNVYGPKGFQKAIDLILKKVFPYMNGRIDLKITEINKGIVEKKENFTVSCVPVKHVAGSFAYKIESKGKSIVYSGDTAPCEPLIKLANEADLLIHECSFTDDYEDKMDDHTVPNQLGKLAAAANVKSLILTHMYPVCEGEEKNMIKSVRKSFRGQIIVGHDFLRVKL